MNNKTNSKLDALLVRNLVCFLYKIYFCYIYKFTSCNTIRCTGSYFFISVDAFLFNRNILD